MAFIPRQMTDKQRANIFALVGSKTKVNNDLAIQLAKGLGNDAFLREVVWRICTPIAEDVYINIRKYSTIHRLNYIDVCRTMIEDIRRCDNGLSGQCLAEYLQNAALAGYAPVLDKPYEIIEEFYLPIV